MGQGGATYKPRIVSGAGVVPLAFLGIVSGSPPAQLTSVGMVSDPHPANWQFWESQVAPGGCRSHLPEL